MHDHWQHQKCACISHRLTSAPQHFLQYQKKGVQGSTHTHTHIQVRRDATSLWCRTYSFASSAPTELQDTASATKVQQITQGNLTTPDKLQPSAPQQPVLGQHVQIQIFADKPANLSAKQKWTAYAFICACKYSGSLTTNHQNSHSQRFCQVVNHQRRAVLTSDCRSTT